MRVQLSLLACAALAAAGCETPAEEARDRFSHAYSCPKEGVDLRERRDLDAYTLLWGKPKGPPADVAANPSRLAMWQADQEKKRSSWSDKAVFELKGCGHGALYICDTKTSTNSATQNTSGWSCGEQPYPPGTSKW